MPRPTELCDALAYVGKDLALSVVDDLTARGRFEATVSPDQLVTDAAGRKAYEWDGLTAFRVRPALVVLAELADEVAAAVRDGNLHPLVLFDLAPPRGNAFSLYQPIQHVDFSIRGIEPQMPSRKAADAG